MNALVRELEALRGEIYRAKGFVPTDDGTVYVDMSEAELSVEEAPGREEMGGLAIIAHGDASVGVQEMVRRLAR